MAPVTVRCIVDDVDAAIAFYTQRRKSEPGGWNRIQLQVHDLASEVEALRKAGAHFRNDIVTGMPLGGDVRVARR